MAKTKALISFAVTAKLICVFVFAYAKSRFSNDEALIIITANDQSDKIFILNKKNLTQGIDCPCPRAIYIYISIISKHLLQSCLINRKQIIGICGSRGQIFDYMTKMAVMVIYGKKNTNLLSPEPKGLSPI